MNSLSVAVLLVAIALASAGLAPLDSAAVIAGPSGTVVRSGLAPLATPLAAPYLASPLAAPLAIAPHAQLLQAPIALAVPAGSGLEGQYVPDLTEQLYDDGSYKPQIYGL